MRETFGRKKRESPRILLLRDDSSMREATCKNSSALLARYFLYIHSRFLRIPRGIGPKTLGFSPFLCFSSGSWRKYSFPVLASLVNDYSIRKKRNLKSGRIEVNQREYLNYLNFCLCQLHAERINCFKDGNVRCNEK